MRGALFAAPLEQRYEMPKSRSVWPAWIVIQALIFLAVFAISYGGALNLEAALRGRP